VSGKSETQAVVTLAVRDRIHVMRSVHMRAFIVALASGWLLFGCEQAHAAKSETGFAVVELFTSEGCSSCPRADDVLNALAEEASSDGRPVYTLAFHVDYWDKIGWRDPYSASWATQHQQAYVGALQAQGLYTPQMVVNGREEFIGSHAARARSSIARERSKPSSQQLQLHARRDPERVVVSYALSAAPPPNALVRVALVEEEATTDVLAGENAGRRLRHVHVVRAFGSAPAAKSGELSIAWPAELAPERRAHTFVVGYVQQRQTMEITSAARASL
jgi:hypothetical protein